MSAWLTAALRGEGDALIQPLRTVAPLLLDTVRSCRFTDVGTIHNDPTAPMPAMSRSLVLKEADDRMAGELLAAVGPRSPFLVELRRMAGALDGRLRSRMPSASRRRVQLLHGGIPRPGRAGRPALRSSG